MTITETKMELFHTKNQLNHGDSFVSITQTREPNKLYGDLGEEKHTQRKGREVNKTKRSPWVLVSVKERERGLKLYIHSLGDEDSLYFWSFV